MSLERRTVPIAVGGGVSEHTSDVAFDAPLVAEAINVRFPKIGEIAKRNGETLQSSGALPSPATYGSHNAIAEQDGRAVVLTQLGAYLYDPARDTWVSGGVVGPRPSVMRTDTFIRQNNSTTAPEIALVTVNGVTIACVVWSDVDTHGGLYAFAEIPADGSAPRMVSGPTVFTGTRVMSSAFRLTVIGTTIYAVAFEYAGVDSWHSTCDVSSTYTFSTPTSTNPGWGSGSRPLAFFTDATFLYVLLDEGVNSYSIRRLNTSFVEQSSQIVAREALDACLVGTTIAIICATGRLDTVNSALGVAPTSTVITTPGASGPLFVAASRGTICEHVSSGYFLVWGRADSLDPVENTGVVIAHVTSGLATTSIGTTGGVRLTTRAAYRASEGVPLVGLIDDIAPDTFRMGYLARPVLDVAGVYTLGEHARFGQDVAVRASTPSVLYDGASSQWLSPFVAVADATTGSFVTGVNGINMIRFSVEDEPAQRTASASSLRLFAGGCGVTYTDGVVHAEVSPSPIGLIGNALTDVSGIYMAGVTVPASLNIALAVRWRDERGNLHRSIALKQTVVAWATGAPDLALRLSIPRPFPATIRGDRGGQSYEVEVYQDNATDGLYYLNAVVTPQPHPTKPGIDFVVISSALNPIPAYPVGEDYIAEINGSSAGAQYWADAGEVTHVPPPPVVDLISTQSRLWALSAENGRLDIIPSKLLTRGYAPEFSTSLRITLPDEGGECVALAALNDKVIAFKERLVYAIFGDLGDNTGAGNTLQTPRLIQGDVGCANPQSVVEGPFGVVFRSSAGGFHLVSAALDVTRLPNLEDSLADYAVTSGVLVADKKEVRWSLDDGTQTLGLTLVWDYESNAWCTRTDVLPTAAACVVGGQYTRVTYSGSILASRDTWSTTFDTHKMLVTSAWVKPGNGLQAFARVWKSLYLLRWRAGRVIVRIGYDYIPLWTDERTWTTTEIAALNDYGMVALEVQHTIQKCRAFRFQLEEVTEVGQATYAGEGFSLLGVQIELGVKRGSFARATRQESRK